MKCSYFIRSGYTRIPVCKCATYPGNPISKNVKNVGGGTRVDDQYAHMYCENIDNGCPMYKGDCKHCQSPLSADRQYCRICGSY